MASYPNWKNWQLASGNWQLAALQKPVKAYHGHQTMRKTSVCKLAAPNCGPVCRGCSSHCRVRSTCFGRRNRKTQQTGSGNRVCCTQCIPRQMQARWENLAWNSLGSLFGSFKRYLIYELICSLILKLSGIQVICHSNYRVLLWAIAAARCCIKLELETCPK